MSISSSGSAGLAAMLQQVLHHHQQRIFSSTMLTIAPMSVAHGDGYYPRFMMARDCMLDYQEARAPKQIPNASHPSPLTLASIDAPIRHLRNSDTWPEFSGTLPNTDQLRDFDLANNSTPTKP